MVIFFFLILAVSAGMKLLVRTATGRARQNASQELSWPYGEGQKYV